MQYPRGQPDAGGEVKVDRGGAVIRYIDRSGLGDTVLTPEVEDHTRAKAEAAGFWPRGTWVADAEGDVYRVAYIWNGCMGMIAFGRHMFVSDWAESKDGYVELPPLPDMHKLADKGFRISGSAANCTKPRPDWQRFVTIWEMEVRSGSSRAVWCKKHKGWRWLVTRLVPGVY
jgi:hypothetical protein